ncbi:MAG: prolipoprotein diacylglyceryl transferase [Alphaproteobacteria bacterium]|nr:prolipoprotein diacylglyceryl transferase [Alphaproteobacteria bacterium]
MPGLPAFVIAYPAIDPVAIAIGPFALRWYALAYIVGLVLGWRYVVWLCRGESAFKRSDVDDFLVWAVIAVVLGGRLGSVVFYNLDYYLERPLEALYIWRGGMSFHGGLIGVAVAIVLFARQRRIAVLRLADPIACATPIGLFFGRLANFVNGELYGRPSTAPWAMVFPAGGPEPRHPSQLYEAALEGVVLFVLLALAWRRRAWRERPGLLTGIFLTGYAVARGIGELFREPDAQIGFLAAGATLGQLLSLPMLAAGLYLIWRGAARPLAARP